MKKIKKIGEAVLFYIALVAIGSVAVLIWMKKFYPEGMNKEIISRNALLDLVIIVIIIFCTWNRIQTKKQNNMVEKIRELNE